VELFVIIGSEYLDPKHPYTLTKWMGAEELFKMVKFIAIPRGWTDIEKAKTWAKRVPNADVEVIYAPSVPVSSEDIRNLVKEGNPTLYCTPFDVAQLIAKKGLYGSDKPEAHKKRR
jgi:nicotinic acid mononucleotide adenylyltransferase